MVREIKFRAWDKPSAKMWGWNLVHTKNGLSSFIDNNNFILMQFTGLKDKNGKEIYEGDVLEIFGKTGVFEVCFKDGGWHFKRLNHHNTLWDIALQINYGELRLQVIGNIYENPELLKEESASK